MGFLRSTVVVLAALAANQALAWGDHVSVSYRAFEKMPEVSSATPVTVESLDSFLRAEENTIEALLASQEAWGRANLEKYPARPATLAFTADPTRSDEARRTAFLMALRIAPNSKFALYCQPDSWNLPSTGATLPANAVSSVHEANAVPGRYLAMKAGDSAPALAVLATATDEPDLGFDVFLWEDSPSEWGRLYGFGPQPFGPTHTAYGSQLPFHTGFLHEGRLLNLSAPYAKRAYPLLRSHQFSTLSSLAFRTGHAYWGWRFAGLSLHYVQELTNPYQAKAAPGEPQAKLVMANAMALTGFGGIREELMQLQSNRHQAIQKYLSELLERNAANRQEGPLEKALRFADKDRNYPEWNDRYLRDVVSAQASQAAASLAQTVLATLPSAYVNDPAFDFGSKDSALSLLNDMAKRDPNDRLRLENALAELMGNLGAHSRNALRGILRAGSPL